MNAKEFLAAKGIYGLDTKKRMEEVLQWMEDYHQSKLSESGWISADERLPEDFNEFNQTQYYLCYISNPYFEKHHCHVAFYEKGTFGNAWRGIEPNVAHGKDFPIVTHWMPLPKPPQNQ